MKKHFASIFFFLLIINTCIAQNRFTDSIMLLLKRAENDTTRVLMLGQMCTIYRLNNVDSSILYGNRGLKLSQQIKFLRGEADVLNRLGVTYREMGDFPKSLELLFVAMKIAEENHFPGERASAQRRIGLVYRDLKYSHKRASIHASGIANPKKAP